MAERRFLPVALLLLCGLNGTGCAAVPYKYGSFQSANEVDLPSEVTVSFGKPHKGLDRLAWVIGLPSRILPLHGSVNNHSLSEETSDKLKKYLRENELTDVYVRVNQYDPAGEWQRLQENDRIAPGWRYSVGALGLVAYTILPGRVFGGDLYNPFTNSLYINSDVAAVVLAEAAYAKDIHSRRLPGPYATLNEFPLLSLWRHVHAINDVLGYSQTEEDWELERETYRVVYPQMGIHAAGGGHTIAAFITTMPLFTIPLVAVVGAVAGHAVGQTNIAQRHAVWNQELPFHADTQEIQLSGHTEPAESAVTNR